MTAEAWGIRDLLAESPTPQVLTTGEVDALAEELAAYHAHFAPCFTRSEQRDWAAVYLHGLLLAEVPRMNTEAMALLLLGAGDGAEARVRALQQFKAKVDQAAPSDLTLRDKDRYLWGKSFHQQLKEDIHRAFSAGADQRSDEDLSETLARP